LKATVLFLLLHIPEEANYVLDCPEDWSSRKGNPLLQEKMEIPLHLL